jgi:prophage maintenance system killer protein
MIYLKLKDYNEFIFNAIRNLVYDDKQKPEYEKDKGIPQLKAILERIQTHYYPNYYKKAAYLFVALSTGHYFENGNKRIALFSYIYFHQINKLRFRSIRKKQYTQWFKDYFPNYRLSHEHFRSNAGWALYNFNKAMNIKLDSNEQGHSYSFDELKEITENFIRFISVKK